MAGAQRIKAVVRKLPPNLPEEIFWRSCELWVNDNTVKERWYVKGALKGTRLSTSSLFSRAYIAFRSPEELATFSQNYDGHLFRDKQGNEFSAIVEFAPSQKLPLTNPKVDARQGTIEDDEDYKSFISLIEKGENPSKEKATTQIVSDPSKPESTPLLEALITSKKHTSAAASGGKFSKHKQQHAGSSKPRAKEDDAHFSRAQPIVPTGPVTLLTAPKPEGSSKPTTTTNPVLSPTLSAKSVVPAKETGGKGKGKGKGGAKGGESQDTPSKPSGKGKSTPKAKQGGNADTSGTAGEASTSKPNTQKDDAAKKLPTPKKKKPAPAAQTNPAAVGETGDKGAEDAPAAAGRGRGRGRGGAGRGGVVVVPKILTKIISEGTTQPGKSGQPSSSTTTPASSGTASATEGPSSTRDTVEGAAGSSQAAPGPRGGDRGGRPPFRGRGRGRGRGAPRGGAAAAES